jgi:hypothetical protein
LAALTASWAGTAIAASATLNAGTTTVDDAWVDTDTPNTNYGTGANLVDNPNGFHPGVVGYKSMFALVPATSGGQSIVIDSATITVTTSGPGWIKIYRMTSDWMVKAAGLSQLNVTGNRRDLAGGLSWAAGQFGAADYDTVSFLTSTTPSAYNAQSTYNVTALVSGMYQLGVNDGFAINTSGGYLRASEFGNSTPSLVVNYHYTPEPATLSLLAVAGLAMLKRRK